jgi:hypothetical protein
MTIIWGCSLRCDGASCCLSEELSFEILKHRARPGGLYLTPKERFLDEVACSLIYDAHQWSLWSLPRFVG